MASAQPQMLETVQTNTTDQARWSSYLFSTDLAHHLDEIVDSGEDSFWGGGSLAGYSFALQVDGFGPILAPISTADCKRLIGVSKQAPFGKGTETIVDVAVRKTWEIDASKITLSKEPSPYWLGHAVAQACEHMGLSAAAHGVHAELYKLSIYEDGAMFKPHRDSVKAPGMFGTLVVSLPSLHQGGDVILQFGGEKRILRTSDRFPYAQFLAWYADVIHEVTPVTYGHRVVLTFNLINPDHVPQPLPVTTEPSLGGLQATLEKWKQDFDDGGNLPRHLFYMLDHRYTDHGLAQSILKGRDRQVTAALSKVLGEAKCICYLVTVEKKVTGAAEEDSFNEYDKWYEEDEDEEDYDDDEQYRNERQHARRGQCYHQLTDADEETTTFRTIVSLSGEPVHLSNLDGLVFEEDYVLNNREFEEREPEEEDYEGFTGNAGAWATHWYRETALLLMPQAHAPAYFGAQDATGLKTIYKGHSEDYVIEVIADQSRRTNLDGDHVHVFAKAALELKRLDLFESLLRGNGDKCSNRFLGDIAHLKVAYLYPFIGFIEDGVDAAIDHQPTFTARYESLQVFVETVLLHDTLVERDDVLEWRVSKLNQIIPPLADTDEDTALFLLEICAFEGVEFFKERYVPSILKVSKEALSDSLWRRHDSVVPLLRSRATDISLMLRVFSLAASSSLCVEPLRTAITKTLESLMPAVLSAFSIGEVHAVAEPYHWQLIQFHRDLITLKMQDHAYQLVEKVKEDCVVSPPCSSHRVLKLVEFSKGLAEMAREWNRSLLVTRYRDLLDTAWTAVLKSELAFLGEYATSIHHVLVDLGLFPSMKILMEGIERICLPQWTGRARITFLPFFRQVVIHLGQHSQTIDQIGYREAVSSAWLTYMDEVLGELEAVSSAGKTLLDLNLLPEMQVLCSKFAYRCDSMSNDWLWTHALPLVRCIAHAPVARHAGGEMAGCHGSVAHILKLFLGRPLTAAMRLKTNDLITLHDLLVQVGLFEHIPTLIERVPAAAAEDIMLTCTPECLLLFITHVRDSSLARGTTIQDAGCVKPLANIFDLLIAKTEVRTSKTWRSAHRELLKMNMVVQGRQLMTMMLNEHLPRESEPFLRDTLESVEAVGLDLDTIGYTAPVKAMISILARRSKPSLEKSWTLDRVGCGCQECRILDMFLQASNSEYGRMQYKQAQRTHLEQRLAPLVRKGLVWLKTLHEGSPRTLEVFKTKSAMAMPLEHWHARISVTFEWLKKMSLPRALLQYAADEYRGVLDTYPHGTVFSGLPPPLPQSATSNSAQNHPATSGIGRKRSREEEGSSASHDRKSGPIRE